VRSGVRENVIVAQLLENLPAFYVTRKIHYHIHKACHWSLSGPDKSSLHPPTFFIKIHFNVILPYTVGLQMIFFVQVFYKNFLCIHIRCSLYIHLSLSLPRYIYIYIYLLLLQLALQPLVCFGLIDNCPPGFSIG
jgi:hypothetical protein